MHRGKRGHGRVEIDGQEVPADNRPGVVSRAAAFLHREDDRLSRKHGVGVPAGRDVASLVVAEKERLFALGREAAASDVLQPETSVPTAVLRPA